MGRRKKNKKSDSMTKIIEKDEINNDIPIIDDIKITSQKKVKIIDMYLLKEFFKNYFYGILNKKRFRLSCLIFLFCLATFFISYNIGNQGNPLYVYLPLIKKSDLPTQQKVRQLEISFNGYLKATPADHLYYWISKYLRITYELNGNPRHGQYDCSSAVVHYLWGWGSNVPSENVERMKLRAEKIDKLGSSIIRKRWNKVQPGDIVIIKTNRTVWHCGVVYRVVRSGKYKGTILYMEVSSSVNGMGFNKFRWGARKVVMVFHPNFYYWIGNLFSESKK